jgi:predicted dehydrogenase
MTQQRKKIGTAVLGAGGAGRKIMGKDIAEHSHLYDLRGFYDPFPATMEKVREEFPSAITYPAFEALLDDPSVELMLIATSPHRSHPGQAIQALQAGEHSVVIKTSLG